MLHRGGRLVTLQAPPDADLVEGARVEAVFFIVGPDHETLAAVADLADRDELHIEIAATYPLAGGRAAYISGAGLPRPPGKTVLVIR